MADYKVTDTELTSIANAIRTKGGTSEQLTFPSDFITAIGNISGGGGSVNFLSGTDAPTSDVGSDGAIYLRYKNLGESITNVRMVIYDVRGSGGDTQVTEVELLDESDNVVAWGDGTATSNGNVYSSSQQAEKAFDGVTDNKWYTSSRPSSGNPIWIDFEPETPIPSNNIGSWRWWTGGDTASRDPVTFDLQFSNDGGDTYVTVDSAVNEEITENRNAIAYTKELIDGEITATYLKVNGAWQNLIGSVIDDVNTGD